MFPSQLLFQTIAFQSLARPGLDVEINGATDHQITRRYQIEAVEAFQEVASLFVAHKRVARNFRLLVQVPESSGVAGVSGARGRSPRRGVSVHC